jgi:two-component system, sensor histidine kinase and response regulator
MGEPGTILVVDDQPENVGLLVDLLGSEGHRVLVALDGAAALERLARTSPDLVILDVMMPGLDGYEVCRRIRASADTKHLPVIFMSALADTSARVRGLEVGAADFVSKPFRQEEVLARVRTHLELGRLHRDLEERNRQLRAFAHTVAHDLKGPLAVVQMSLQGLRRTGGDEPERPARWQRSLDRALRGAAECVGTVDTLLLLAETSHRAVEPAPIDMAGLVSDLLDGAVGELARSRGAKLELGDLPPSLGHAAWLRQVWANLLDNACKHGGPAPRVQIDGQALTGGRVRYRVRDFGPGVASEVTSALFQPFERRHEGDVEGQGLGLTLVLEVVERLGGCVGVESPAGGGARFWFELRSV